MRLLLGASGVAAICLLAAPAQAIINPAGSNCSFTLAAPATQLLQGDCTTTETILLDDGETLDGQGYAITAEDPPDPGHFLGAVIENAGTASEVHITNLVIHGNLTKNVCDAGADRLRGILLEGAAGSVTQSTVQNINQGASGCQEGNAIEVRNSPFDGTGSADLPVTIAHNVIEDWQKTGIVCNGDVDCTVQHNVVGKSADEQTLAPNSVQIGFGARGLVAYNHIAGNEWLGTSDFVGTAVLVFAAEAATIRQNNIGGNAQVGIYVASGNTTVDNNRVFERDADRGALTYDFGLIDAGGGNSFTNNKVRGYDVPATASPDDGEISGTKVIPAPQDPGAACFLPDTSAQSC